MTPSQDLFNALHDDDDDDDDDDNMYHECVEVEYIIFIKYIVKVFILYNFLKFSQDITYGLKYKKFIFNLEWCNMCKERR